MSTYLIGDIQGCFAELQDLLNLISFDPKKDRLGFVGDLVNRGPDSLKVLRFIKSLHNPLVVLGNHDLYLLILGYGLMPEDSYSHTLHDLLKAPDKLILLDWLRQQPFIIHDPSESFFMVHAGIPPQWNIEKSIPYAQEVEAILRGPHYLSFLKNLFGNAPNEWNEQLKGDDRLRYITNAFTRMRYCTKEGKLILKEDADPSALNVNQSNNLYKPWFSFRDYSSDQVDIIFGHWAALGGQCPMPHIFALDTGCAWGHELTALRIEDKKRFSVPSRGESYAFKIM